MFMTFLIASIQILLGLTQFRPSQKFTSYIFMTAWGTFVRAQTTIDSSHEFQFYTQNSIWDLIPNSFIIDP